MTWQQFKTSRSMQLLKVNATSKHLTAQLVNHPDGIQPDSHGQHPAAEHN
jgi:hypothetical protein